MLISSEGIVLKQRKIANNRRMITVFTKTYGKISCGTSLNEKSKGKSALAIRPFSYGEYDFYKGRDSYSINSSQLKKSYYSIGENLERFMVSSKFIEYLDKILEESQPRPGLFDMTLEFLDVISKSNSNFDTLLYAFIVKTLRMQGVAPELKKCVDCGKDVSEFGYKIPNGKIGHVFSITSGGIVCEECGRIEKTEDNSLICSPAFDIIEVLDYLSYYPLEKFEKVGLKEDISNYLKRMLGLYIDRYLGIDVLLEDMSWR